LFPFGLAILKFPENDYAGYRRV